MSLLHSWPGRRLLVALMLLGVWLLPAADAEAAIGPCRGKLVKVYPLIHRGTQIASLAIYWNAATGENCARMNHVGPTYGVRTYTQVGMATCSGRTDSTCYPFRAEANNEGNFAYYAGPIKVPARGRCITAAGRIFWKGDIRIVGTPGPAHCR